MGDDTASRRPPTGLDRGARGLILQIAGEAVEGLTPAAIEGVLFTDRFGGRADYFDAVEKVWGEGYAYGLKDAIASAEVDAEFGANPMARRGNPRSAGSLALLLGMPEPDFRLAIEQTLAGFAAFDPSERITAVCRARGAPWRFTDGRFEWVGDELVEQEVLRPALSALQDQRFAGGVKSEFEAARDELRQGHPNALKQAIVEAGSAVESAMKVVLDDHSVPYSPKDTAQKLFDALVSAGIVPKYMERAVLGAATPRNKTAGHGAGATAHAVATDEAEAVVTSAASAIGYLRKKLR